jgi:hypothetical protein
MTMQDQWIDRLSEDLDGELSPDERSALESHLVGCERCRTTLEELTRVVERARRLPVRAPDVDLWDPIAERIGAPMPKVSHVAPFRPRTPRRISLTLPQLAAASVVLALLSGGAAWRIRGGSARGSAELPVRPNGAGSADLQVRSSGDNDSQFVPVAERVGLADAQYDSAVVDLQRALARGRGHLDPATITILEENLTIIDRAIDQATQAVMGDPGNTYLTGHLVETRRKKLDLLRRAAALASETN